MKRIKSACICQTLHFMLKEGISSDYAASLVKQEVEHYKKGMEQNGTKFRIISETEQPDGSIIIEIIKQYNSRPVGKYLD